MAAPNVLIFGTGEYVTGWTNQGGSQSDKKLGVVGLVHFDLRARGKVGQKIGLCGTNGTKFEQIREHFDKNLTFTGMSTDFDHYPDKTVSWNPEAYKEALLDFQPGDCCCVFTPDETHYDIIKAALERGLHCIATKPMVKTLAQHKELVQIAEKNQVLLQIEVHKRFDPMYNDARMRVKGLGNFGFFQSYMSQPKFQLETFRAWAGKSSDISYYLNSHHVDFHCWCMDGLAVPITVRAIASTGVAEKILERPCEDTITLTVVWKNKDNSKGTAVYTASWVASKADVHSQQRFFCQMEKGEITTDQCHRGYTVAEDGVGFNSLNPLYIRNTPDHKGRYVGQSGYGYVSFEKFIDAVAEIRAGQATPQEFDHDLPTGRSTQVVTAILEAGRISLDTGAEVEITYDSNGDPQDLVVSKK